MEQQPSSAHGTPTGQHVRAPTCLLLLCGLPGAGKSTLATAIKRYAETLGSDSAQNMQQGTDSTPAAAAAAAAAVSAGEEQQQQQQPVRVEIVSFDSYELALQQEPPQEQRQRQRQQQHPPESQFDPAAWKAARAAALAAVEAALTLGKHRQQHGNHHEQQVQQQQVQQQQQQQQQLMLVIVDDTMHYRSMRHRCYMIARATGAAFIQLHVCCSEEQAGLRNERRAQQQQAQAQQQQQQQLVPPDVIRRMAAVFEPPLQPSSSGRSGGSSSNVGRDSSAAWELNTAVLSWPLPHAAGNTPAAAALASASAAETAAEVWRQVWEAWGQPAPPPYDSAAADAARCAAQRATAASAAHALDLASRQVVSAAAAQLRQRAVPRQQAGEALAAIGAARKQLLLQYKQQHALQGAAAEPTIAGLTEVFQRQCAAIVDASM